MNPTKRIAEITARQKERREQEKEAAKKSAAATKDRLTRQDASKRRLLAPRSVKRFRSRCEEVKRSLLRRAAKAEEEATGWAGDPQRWAGLTLFSQLLRLQIESIDSVLDRLNELLIETEPAGKQPIEAVIELGRELNIEKRLGEGWAERCRQPYERGAYKHRKKRRRRKLTSSKRC